MVREIRYDDDDYYRADQVSLDLLDQLDMMGPKDSVADSGNLEKKGP